MGFVKRHVVKTFPHAAAGGGGGWTVTATWEAFTVGANGGDANLGSGDGLYAGNSRTSVTNTYAHGGTKSLSIHIPLAADDTFQNEFRLPTDITEGQELWGRFYMYVPAGFDWTCAPITKLFRFAVVDSSNAGVGYISILATKPSNYDCAASSDVFGFIVGGAEYNSAYQFVCQNVDASSHYLDTGRWHCLELYVKVGTSSNGTYRLWHDGTLIWERTALNIGPVGSKIWHGDAITVCHFLGFWNGGSPADQYLYFDDFILTNSRPANQDSHGNYMIGT